MKIRITAVLFIFFCLAGAAAPAQEETDKGGMGFSAGVQVHYAWWSGIWQKMDMTLSKTIMRLYMPATPLPSDSQFLYNPVFLWRLNNTYSISGSFLFTINN